MVESREHIGESVYVIGDHPWSGCAGEIRAYDKTFGYLVRICSEDRFENGHTCYVLPDNLRRNRRTS